MRALPVPLLLLLLLLIPVPGRSGGCPPCPPGVPEPCDSRCPPCARTRSPAEEEPEELCPPCPPCTRCDREVSPNSEAPSPCPHPRSKGPHALPVFGGPADEAAAPLPEGTPRSPRVTPPVSPEPPPGDIIPLYCALLAAIVVGLLAYVAFKCWDSCRKKRQLDKARDTGDTGDGEELRGDSGVYLESPGSEHRSPEGLSPLPAVSPRRQEELGELEKLLELGSPGSDRRGPAGTPGDVTSAV